MKDDENNKNELLLENTIIGNNINDIKKNTSTKLSKEIKKIEMYEINFPYVNINYENSEIIKKNFVDSLNENNNKIKYNSTLNNSNEELENKRKKLEMAIKINIKDTKINLNQINKNVLDYEKNIKNKNDKPKIHLNNNLIKNTSNNINNKIPSNNNSFKKNDDEIFNNINIIKINDEKSEKEKFLYEIIKKPKNTDLSFKILVVGDYGVGKTSLIKNNSLKEFYKINEELTEFYIKNNKKIIKFQIYETYGLEKYNSFYKNISLAILVYSIDNLKSFENIEKKWLNEIKTKCNKDIKIFLIGNKIDLNVKREVDKKWVKN